MLHPPHDGGESTVNALSLRLELSPIAGNVNSKATTANTHARGIPWMRATEEDRTEFGIRMFKVMLLSGQRTLPELAAPTEIFRLTWWAQRAFYIDMRNSNKKRSIKSRFIISIRNLSPYELTGRRQMPLSASLPRRSEGFGLTAC